MNRKDITPNGEYVVEDGTVVRVFDTDTGWGVVDGEWVAQPSTDRRYMGPVKGWQTYQSNPNIRATIIGRMDGAEFARARRHIKTVVPPRTLVGDIEHWQADHKARTVEDKQFALEAKHVSRILSRKGVRGDVDTDRGTVTISLREFAEAFNG